MTTSIIKILENHSVQEQNQELSYRYCKLYWGQGKLLVMQDELTKQPCMSSLEKKEFLVKCLEHSPVNLVRIDSRLSEDKLMLWVEACEVALKPTFLRIPCSNQQPKFESYFLHYLKRFLEWVGTLILLLVMSPVVLLLILLQLRSRSSDSLFEMQWQVGQRGRLFKAIKFRTTTVNKKHNTFLLNLLFKYGLYNLPLLFNVLRGEISLIGKRRCISLQEAVKLTSEEQKKLNYLPGLINSWQIETQAELLHLDSQTL